MGALSHLRIIEIGSAAATSYCARLFADFGADVQKIEPAQGDPLRRAAPLTPGGQSAWFAFLNFNKSSVMLDRNDARAASRLSELIGVCDILLDGRGLDAADCPDIDLDAIKRDNPGLIHLDLSWFGDRGPYANFAATDATIRALTGLVKLVGPEQGPPMHAPDFQTGILGGLWGVIAASSSVLGRMQDGRGRASHLSMFEASIAVTEYIMFEAFSRGDIMRRIGVNRFWPTFPVGIYETKQGWLGVTTVTPAQWRSFCEMLGLLDLRDDPTLFLGVDRLQHVADIEGKILPRLKQRTAQEWFAEGLKRKIPIVPVPEISDLIADEEKRARGAIVPITIGEESGFSAGTMQRLTGTPPLRGGRVPNVGEQQAKREAAPRAAAPKPAAANRLPLEGIRVVDFSMGWAGPICTRTLADLGADVIKIEAIQYPDWWRGVDRRPAYVLEQMYEKSVRYCIMNRNKRGITLDLTRPKGLALAKRLLADADLVVDNYSVEVLPKLGLGYEVLSKINPKLVMMSMSAFGAGSVYRDCRAYGSTLE
ncbi:CaiB/BaiF CoA-transferase family protein, partial [Bradyrhizobium macuxiense]|uniref:CaiB/BaiF CoA-transferase family protein n=1 Tax=Bradyrhizobium macuxiense TaxID=1755647 RepID=UPI001FD918CA